jgi:hypothetical protein
MSKQMRMPPDFVDLLTEFASAEVRYLLIGGYAVGYHDRPRTTKDIDLLVYRDPENIERACRALQAFGAPPGTVDDLRNATEEDIVWMGVPPARIDLLLSAPGIEFEGAWARRVIETWEGVTVSVVALPDLIAAKTAAGREQDLVDVRNLERALARQKT